MSPQSGCRLCVGTVRSQNRIRGSATRSRTFFATRESTSFQSSEFGSRVGGTRTRGFDGEDGDSSSFAASQGSRTRTPSSVDSGCSEGGSEDENRPSRESIGSLAGLFWTGDRRVEECVEESQRSRAGTTSREADCGVQRVHRAQPEEGRSRDSFARGCTRSNELQPFRLSPRNGPTTSVSLASLNLTFDEDIQFEGTRAVDLCTNSVAGSGAGCAHVEYADGSVADHPVTRERFVLHFGCRVGPGIASDSNWVHFDGCKSSARFQRQPFRGSRRQRRQCCRGGTSYVPNGTVTFPAGEASPTTTIVVSFVEAVQLAGGNASFRIALWSRA